MSSSGSAYDLVNVTFQPSEISSIFVETDHSVNTAGNVTNITFSPVDMFGNIDSGETIGLNIIVKDLSGNIIHDTDTSVSASDITFLDINKTSAAFSYTGSLSNSSTLSLNSTVAGNISINSTVGLVSNMTYIDVIPGSPGLMRVVYDDDHTVNTSSSIYVSVYDVYENPVENANITFSVTSPTNTVYNSPVAYNSVSIASDSGSTDINGKFSNIFTADKRAGDNIVQVSVVNTSLSSNISITGLADEIDNLFLTHSPEVALSNNADRYTLSARPVDQFLNPIIPLTTPIKEQVRFTTDSGNLVLVPLNSQGRANTIVGPTPYIESLSVTATYKNGSGYTNFTNITTLDFKAGPLHIMDFYAVPNTVLAQGLNGNHESDIALIALDEWGHSLPDINVTFNNTNATVGTLTIDGVNSTLINATTDSEGRIYGTFTGNVSGNTSVLATSGNISRSTNISVKSEPFMSIYLNVKPSSVTSGSLVNITTVISAEGELPITRPAASAMLVLDRSGSMDPDYYAGTPLDVVLVIDRSGSMKFLGNSPEQPMTDAKTAAKNFVSNLLSNAQAGVVSFSSSSSIDKQLALLNSSDNKASVISAIDIISANGGTAMGDGMADANSVLINGRPGSKKVMIVLTDGVCNAGSDREGQTAIATANANGITIYTIGLGTAEYIDEPLLQSIALETGGLYYNAPTSSELSEVYNSIAQEISDYDVSSVEYGTQGFTPYDYTFEDSIPAGGSFETTFEINDTINDLKVKLDWAESSSDLDIQLISPSGKIYGKNNDTTGYYFDRREEVPIDVRSPVFDTYITFAEPSDDKSSETRLYITDNLGGASEESAIFRWKLPDTPTHNAQVESVKMYLYGVSNSQDASNNRYIDIFDVSTNFTNPTWSQNYSGSTWISGDFSTSDYNSSYTVYSKYLTSSVENNAIEFDITDAQWGADRLPEWGESCAIVLMGSGYNSWEYDRFASSDTNPNDYQYDLNGRRPLVTVTYSLTRDTSEYVWISPLSYVHPDDDHVETGEWILKVTNAGTVDEDFSVSTYIDKLSASKLSSHAFMTSFDESRGDKAGLAMYSFEDVVLSDNQTSYVLDNSTWVGYFTAETDGLYTFNVSWDDTSLIDVRLYEGIDVLSSSNGTGVCEVSSMLSAGDTYYLDMVKGAGSLTDTRFRINVSTSEPDTVMTAYYDSSGGGGTPKFRTWNGLEWSVEQSANYVGGSPYYVVLESSPVSPEVIMGTADSNYDVNVQVWDGSSWGSADQFSGNLDSYAQRGFDIKYEQVSGDAIVAYMDKGINDGVPRYRVWDGDSWSSGASVDGSSPGSGDVGWVRLDANPNSDEMVLVTLDDERDMRAQVWDGDSWGYPVFITNDARATSYQCFDVVYEQDTGRAMVVWADMGTDSVRYLIWDGSSWSSASNLYTPDERVYWIKLAADPNSNNILLAAEDNAHDIHVASWDGSLWSVPSEIETGVYEYERRSVDVAFEQSSGMGMVVWGDSSSTPKYSLWDGSSWTSESSASNLGGSGYTRWVQLTPDPASDDIFLMTSDGNNDLNVQKWDGSFWGIVSEVETSSTRYYECFDIAFSDQEDIGVSTPVSWNQWTASVTSTLENDSLSHLENAIDTITADGLTAIDEGLYVANNELSPVDGNSTIVLMTDGLDNAGYHSLLEEAYRARDNNTVIYTVGFGNDESEVDPVLEEIATITGGEYYFAPNSSVLEEIFIGIASQITNFSAGGPILDIHVPHNYITSLSVAKATYISGSSNATTGNASVFETPKAPATGNAEPTITTTTGKSILEWQLPNMGAGDKWGIWYQMRVDGAGYVPIIMPTSTVTYTDLSGENITVYVPASGSASLGGGAAGVLSYSLGSLDMEPDRTIMPIANTANIRLTLLDTMGNSSFAYVHLYSNIGYFGNYENPINVTVVGSDSVNFTCINAGKACITAYAYNVNNASDVLVSGEEIYVRPKGIISIH
ncbi:MAG: VWA domain-containing protein [Methanolobus sp.]|nr:VWA domain-containing protein [Methanolobus sp.]